jgi:hypothetical protein
MMPDWKKALPFYAFRCEKHGVVENYLHGYGRYLGCPKCEEEKK